MERSENYNFYLPSSNSDDIADISQISENFRIVDEKIPSKENLEALNKDIIKLKKDINAEGKNYVGVTDTLLLGLNTNVIQLQSGETHSANEGDIVRVDWRRFDFNGDGVVDDLDYEILRNAQTGLIEFDAKYDLDANGRLDATDLSIFKKYQAFGFACEWNGAVWISYQPYNELSYNPKSLKAQSGVAVAEAVKNKEDKSNKVSDLFVGSDELTHEQYPSAKATREFVNSIGSSLSSSVEEVRNIALSIDNDKEDAINKAKTYSDVNTTSQTQYLSSNAVTGYLNSMYAGIEQTFQPQIDKKVDKEEGKTLYRGMDVIYKHTITEEEAGVVNIKVETDINGNTFKLDEMYIHIETPTAFEQNATKNVYVVCNNTGGASNYWFTTLFGVGHKHLQAYGKRVMQNRWFNMFHPPASAMYNGQFRGCYSMSTVDYVTWFWVGGLVDFPAGTKILICGRRAD